MPDRRDSANRRAARPPGEDHAQTVFYSRSSGKIVVASWEELAPEVRSMFAQMANGSAAEGERLSPELAPRDSFAALMTPPRAGTFIFHSHALTTTQVADGLYGALIVLAPGERYDPAHEVMWIIGGPERGEGEKGFLYLNGERAPAPLTLVAGRRYRVQLINITENNTGDVALLSSDTPDAAKVTWRPLAKDAAPLPAASSTPRPARLRTSVGETYDFELVASHPGVLRLEVRNGGDLMVQQRVVVR